MTSGNAHRHLKRARHKGISKATGKCGLCPMHGKENKAKPYVQASVRDRRLEAVTADE